MTVVIQKDIGQDIEMDSMRVAKLTKMVSKWETCSIQLRCVIWTEGRDCKVGKYTVDIEHKNCSRMFQRGALIGKVSKLVPLGADEEAVQLTIRVSLAIFAKKLGQRNMVLPLVVALDI